MPTIMSPLELIAELFASAGAGDYLGEPVTVAEHLYQAGLLAGERGVPRCLPGSGRHKSALSLVVGCKISGLPR